MSNVRKPLLWRVCQEGMGNLRCSKYISLWCVAIHRWRMQRRGRLGSRWWWWWCLCQTRVCGSWHTVMWGKMMWKQWSRSCGMSSRSMTTWCILSTRSMSDCTCTFFYSETFKCTRLIIVCIVYFLWRVYMYKKCDIYKVLCKKFVWQIAFLYTKLLYIFLYSSIWKGWECMTWEGRNKGVRPMWM